MKLDEEKLQEVVEKIAYQQFGAEQIDDLCAKMDILNDYVQEQLRIAAVSGSPFTIDDMKKAFMAGADKKYWTKIHLTGVVSGQDYELEPVFEKWFEYYR